MKKVAILLCLNLLMITTTAFAQDVTVGVLIPLSGGGAFYGKIMEKLAKVTIDEINKEGIDGFDKINIRIYDTASDAAVASRMIERAVSQGVSFLWGGFSSSVETIMVKKANELQVPTLLTNEHSYAAFYTDNKYAVTPVLSTYEIGKICAKYMKENAIKTYAFIGADYIYGRTWDKSLSLNLEGTGIKKIYENWHSFKKVDFSADIAKMAKINPDAVIRSYGGAGQYLIVRQMKDFGFWPKAFISGTVNAGYQVMLDELGEKYMTGVISQTGQNPENPNWIEFAKTHKEKYGFLPTWLSHGCHDTLYVIKLTLEKAKSLDKKKLAKAMHEVSYDGVGGFACGPFQDFGYVRKGKAFLVQWVEGPPVWDKNLNVHRKTIMEMEATPMPKEDLDKILIR